MISMAKLGLIVSFVAWVGGVSVVAQVPTAAPPSIDVVHPTPPETMSDAELHDLLSLKPTPATSPAPNVVPSAPQAASISQERQKIEARETKEALKTPAPATKPATKPAPSTTKPLITAPLSTDPLSFDLIHEKKPARTIQPSSDELKQIKKDTTYGYLGEWLKPWEYMKGDKLIEINFENAQLINLIRYFEHQYGLTFILDDVIEPLPGVTDSMRIGNIGSGGKSPMGIRFSFKTEQPFDKKQAWDIFVAFLDMAGLMVVPGPAERVYQITNNEATSRFSKEPLPTFMGIESSLLPDNDTKIRYVYFVQNTDGTVVQTVANSLRSGIASAPIYVTELKALILADKATNIRSTLEVLKELDQPRLPETLSVIQLKKAQADKVKELYDRLSAEEQKAMGPGAGYGATGQSLMTENVRVIADSRTNRLIILGPQDKVRKLEDFIMTEVDTEIDLPYSPLHVYPLKFIDAVTTAGIINDLRKDIETQGGAAAVGGIAGGTKYLSPLVTVTAERSTNSLIINAEYEDFLQIYDLLQKIDTEQPQVATQILVLDVDITDSKALGIQFRDRAADASGNSAVLGQNVHFQTSGLPFSPSNFAPIVQNPNGSGATRLLGDLISLASGNVAGSTVLTLGADAFGIWGMFKVLDAFTKVSVVAKPFLVTTHKYTATINIGDIRRVQTSSVIGGGNLSQNTLGDLSAGLVINLTPQISPDGLITLRVSVTNSQFTGQDVPVSSTGDTNLGNGNRIIKTIDTSVIVESNQVLALGGLVVDRSSETTFKTPILGDIPLLGWFFKNKAKTVQKQSLMILISSQIIHPHTERLIDSFTAAKVADAEAILCRMQEHDQARDPIQTYFFGNDGPPYAHRLRKFAQPVVVQEKRKPLAPIGSPTGRRRAPTISPDIPEYAVDVRVSDELGQTLDSYEIDPTRVPDIPPRAVPVAPIPTTQVSQRRGRGKSLSEFVRAGA